MSTTRRSVIWLGIFSVIGLVLQVLALQDIFHAEVDVRLEWAIVRTALLLSLAFHFFALRELRQQ